MVVTEGVVGVGVVVATSVLLSLQTLTGFVLWLLRRKRPEKTPPPA